MSSILRLLRLRYLLLSSTVGGSYLVHQNYEQFQEKLGSHRKPFEIFQKNLSNVRQITTSSDFIRFERQIKQLQERFLPQLQTLGGIEDEEKRISDLILLSKVYENGSSEKFEAHQRQEKIQEEMMSIQMKYQREIDRLEKELQSLKKQLLLTKDRNANVKKIRRVKKSLIDMYSDVLDELSVYDSNYNVQDQLPRVRPTLNKKILTN